MNRDSFHAWALGIITGVLIGGPMYQHRVIIPFVFIVLVIVALEMVLMAWYLARKWGR